MGWFEHHHYWVLRQEHIVAKPGESAQGIVRLEECHCGAVRTIEYGPSAKLKVTLIPKDFTYREPSHGG